MIENWRALVVAEALSWDRTPYHHAGRIKGVGVDCAMLPAEVYKVAGLPHLQPPEYSLDWHLNREEERLKDWVDRFAVQLPAGWLPQPADLVLYRFGRCYSHTAIVIAWPRVIHAVRQYGQVMQDDGEQYGGARPRLFYEFKGTAK